MISTAWNTMAGKVTPLRQAMREAEITQPAPEGSLTERDYNKLFHDIRVAMNAVVMAQAKLSRSHGELVDAVAALRLLQDLWVEGSKPAGLLLVPIPPPQTSEDIPPDPKTIPPPLPETVIDG